MSVSIVIYREYVQLSGLMVAELEQALKQPSEVLDDMLSISVDCVL